MFERFTDRAQRVVVLAQEEARNLDHDYIGTEHLLLGLIHEEGVGTRALESLEIPMESMRSQVVEMVGRGPSEPRGHVPFTPRAKKVLELSLREAMQLGHNHIGTEHILLGLIREGEGVAAQILVALGADLARVRQAVVQLLAGGEERGGRTWTMTQSEEARGSFVAENAEPRYFPVPPPYTSRDGCSFCGRDLWDLGYAVAGSGAVICEECITAAGEAVSRGRSQSRPQGELLHLAPRATGPVPDPAAVEQIHDAFAAVFGGREPNAHQDDVLEDAVGLERSRFELQARSPQGLGATTHVERIRFESPDRARVRFVIMPRGLGTFAFEGSAVRCGEQWMVSRETWCHVAARVGVQCPPREE